MMKKRSFRLTHWKVAADLNHSIINNIQDDDKLVFSKPLCLKDFVFIEFKKVPRSAPKRSTQITEPKSFNN